MTPGPVVRSPLVPVVCGAAVAVVGLLSLAGWLADLPRLTDWFGVGLSMQANTSLATALAGLATILLGVGWVRTAAAVGLVVGLIGGLTLSEHVTGLDLGIDLLVVDKPWGTAGTMSRGRMGPPGSAAYLVLGVAYLLAAGGRRARLGASVLALVAAAISMIPLVGYVLRVQELYSVSRLTAISLQTVGALLVLAVGLVAAIPDRGVGRIVLTPGPAGLLGRRLLALSLAAPLGVVLVALESIRHGADLSLVLASAVVAMIFLLAITGLTMARRVKVASDRRDEALAERQRAFDRLTLLVERTPLAAIEWDTDRRIVRWSPQAERLFGWSAGEVVGRRLDGIPLVHEEDAPAAAEATERLLGGSEPYLVSAYRNRSADGRVLHCEWYSSAVVDPEGKTEAVLSLVLDATERHRAEQALLRSNAELQRFAYVASHDLREPLRTIVTYAQLLERRYQDGIDDDGREFLRFVSHAALKLNDQILGLLDLSRVSQQELSRRDFDPGVLADEVLRTLQVAISEAGAEIAIDARAPVHADPVLLRQVLQNLVENALKFRRDPCRVTIGSRPDKDGTLLWVKDNGIGIPDQEMSKVFEVFRRGHGHKYPGTGLGLSTSAKIVERHGGRIWIESAEGQGTCVFLSLPRPRARRPADGPYGPAPLALSPPAESAP